MSPRLTLQIVTWNSSAVISECLRSLERQAWRDYQLVIIDNASGDGTLAAVRSLVPNATVIQNQTNRGFAAAHNQGLAVSETEYVGLVNPDILCTRDAIPILIADLDAEKRRASAGGKLLKDGSSSGIIDSAGMLARRNHEVLNRGEGERDQGQFDTPEEVFGISGAFALFRRAALDAVRIGHEVLDEDFFAYKEDVDLSWRLLRAGWCAWYDPRAVVYHRRSVQRRSSMNIRKRRHGRSLMVRQLSYRNQLLLLAKHLSIRDLLRRPHAFWYEIRKFFYLLLLEPRTLLALRGFGALIQRMKAKRNVIERQAVIPQDALNRWFAS